MKLRSLLRTFPLRFHSLPFLSNSRQMFAASRRRMNARFSILNYSIRFQASQSAALLFARGEMPAGREGLRAPATKSQRRRQWLGRLHRSFTSLLLVSVFLQFVILPGQRLVAQPSDANFERFFKQGSDGRLEEYYNAAEGRNAQVEWDQLISQGRALLEAEWEARASAELERRVRQKTDAENEADLRAQLESEKSAAKAEWEIQLSTEVDEARGEWKARATVGSLMGLLDQISREDLLAAVKDADTVLEGTTGTVEERVAAWDSEAYGRSSVMKTAWETALDEKISELRSAAGAMSVAEQDAFEKELALVRNQFMGVYTLEESSILGATRAAQIEKLNKAADLDSAVAQETDPSKLVQLLIEKTRLRVDAQTGELLTKPVSAETPTGVAINWSGDDFQNQVLKAMDAGQQEWAKAIDDLLLQKLKYDREVERKGVQGNQRWAEAYSELLAARAKWNQEIDAQVQRGLREWEKAGAELQTNREQAMADLDRYSAARNAEWENHVRGLEQVVVGGADTLNTIVENVKWFDAALTRLPNEAQYAAVRVEYQNQRKFWADMEGRYRAIVLNSQNTIHERDMLGNGGGAGLLANKGGSDPYVLTSAEFELKIARKELELLEKQRDQAKAVYDFAAAGATRTSEQIAADLNASKTAYSQKEQVYLDLLKELNGTGALVSSSVGLDENSSVNAGESAGTGQTYLERLQIANVELENKRKALEKARAELDLSRDAYDKALRIQVLVQNPGLLGDIGRLETDVNNADKENSGIRYEIQTASEQIEIAREKVRQNEKAYFRTLYEKQNALRSLSYFEDLYKRVSAFEGVKENLAALDAILNKDVDLGAKITEFLGTDVLEKVFGNQGAAQIRENFAELQAGLSAGDAPVIASIDALNSSAETILAAHDGVLVRFTAAEKTKFTGFADSARTARDGLNAIAGIDTASLGLDSVDASLAQMNTLLGDWDDRVSDMQDARSAYESALNDYRTYTSANAGKKGQPEYEEQVLLFVQAAQRYSYAASAFQSYANALRESEAVLKATLSVSFDRAPILIDRALAGAARTTALTGFTSIRSSFSPVATDTDTMIQTQSSSFAALGQEISDIGQALRAHQSALDKRNTSIEDASSYVASVSAAMRSSLLAQKYQLAFLLSEDASLDSLDEAGRALDLERKTMAASVNARGLEILKAKLSGLSAADRNIDRIALVLTQELNEKSLAMKSDSASRLELEALRLARDYILSNGPAIANAFETDTSYSGFVTDLDATLDEARVTLAFYQGGGKLDEAERNRIRESGTPSERRNLAEYYNFTSTLFFAQSVLGAVETETAAVNQMGAFIGQVKSGQIVTILKENYVADQENKLTGLVKELTDALPWFKDISASALYNDSRLRDLLKLSTGDGLTRDDDETARRQNLYTALLDGAAGLMEEVGRLLNLDTLKGIFGQAASLAVFDELTLKQGEMEIAGQEAESLLGSFLSGVRDLANAIPGLLGEFSPAAKVPHDAILEALGQDFPNWEDKSKPLYENVPPADVTDPADPAWIAIDDTNGKAPADAGWLPTYKKIAGFEKPFASLNSDDLSGSLGTLSGELDQWIATGVAYEAAADLLSIRGAALETYMNNHPGETKSAEFQALMADVVSSVQDVSAKHAEYRAYFDRIEAAEKEAVTNAKVLSLEMRATAGLTLDASVLLIPESKIAELPQALKDDMVANPANYHLVALTGSPLQMKIAEYEYSVRLQEAEITRVRMERANSTAGTLAVVENGFSTAGAYVSATEKASQKLLQLANTVLGLPARIIAYIEERPANQISQTDLVSYVKDLKKFFIEKGFRGEEINGAYLQILEEAAAVTDEMDSLLYLQNHAPDPSSRDTANLAEKDFRGVTEATQSMAELESILSGLDASGQPAFRSEQSLKAALQRYDAIVAKLPSGVSIESAIADGMEELREQAFQTHKRNLAMAFLSSPNQSLTTFLEQVKAGKFVIPSQSGQMVQGDASFLGQPLSPAQVAELREYLEPYAKRAVIENAGILANLSAALDASDPDLKEYALFHAYRNFNDASETGYVDASRMPEELRAYAIVSSFANFLTSSDYDPAILADREAAKAEFNTRAGGLSAELLTSLGEFVADYTSKSAAYFLPESLRKFDAAAQYAYESYTVELTPGDMAALTSWINARGYDASVTGSVNAAVRQNYLRSHYYGEDAKEYLTLMDAKLASLTGTGLSQDERDAFLLEQSGIADGYGEYKYSSSALIHSAQVLADFSYENQFGALIDKVHAEQLALQKSQQDFAEDYRRKKFVADKGEGRILIQSYESYTSIGENGLGLVSEETQIANRLKELEKISEYKLGGLFSLLEEYTSFAFRNEPEYDVDLSIRKTIREFADSYSIQDSVFARVGADNAREFEGDLNNLQVKLEQYVNANEPGFAANDPYSNIQSSLGLWEAQKRTIITAGETAVQISILKANGTRPEEELAASKIAYENLEATFRQAQLDFDLAQTNAGNAQDAYNEQQEETSAAYQDVLTADRSLAKNNALYDYAVMNEYSQQQKTAGGPETTIASPLALAKARLEEADQALAAKVAEIKKLEEKVSLEVTLTELKNQAEVAENRAQTEEWALRAMRFSRAETQIQKEVEGIRAQIESARARLNEPLSTLLAHRGQIREDLGGYLDFDSSMYQFSERRLRDRDRMLDGIVTGALGTWDFVNSGRAGSAAFPIYETYYVTQMDPKTKKPVQVARQRIIGWNSVPAFSAGLAQKFPQHDLYKYFQSHNGGDSGSNMNAQNALGPLWWFNDGVSTAQARIGAPNGAAYDAAMEGQLAANTLFQLAILRALDLLIPGVSLPYLGAIASFKDQQAGIGRNYMTAATEGTQLKSLNQQLQEYTDITSVEGLKSILSRTDASGNNKWGLTSDDLALVQGSGNLESLVWTGGKKDLAFSEIVGSDGLSIAHKKAIHDAYGNYVREGETAAGGSSAPITGEKDKYGRAIHMMVSADEFSDALAQMAKTQYAIEREEYYNSAQSVLIRGQKADAKTILAEREEFFHQLTNKASAFGIEYEMYQTIAHDYLGQGSMVDQLFQIELAQRTEVQVKEWDEKEKDFQQRRNEWMRNIEYLKTTGQSRFADMSNELLVSWQNWKDEFKKEADAGKQDYLDQLAETVKKQQAWSTEFMRLADNQSNARVLQDLYEEVQGTINGLRAGLPNDVVLEVNANEILSKLLQSKPELLNETLISEAGSVDTNFFLTQLKNYNFDNSILEQFQEMQKDVEEHSKKMLLLQMLDSLYTLHDANAETIKKANEGLHKELDKSMLFDAWIKMGGVFGRYAHTPTSVATGKGAELQVLPDYQDYKYQKPSALPAVQDSKGTTWNLSDIQSLLSGNGPEASELEVMVRLAKNRISDEFRQVYDPNKKVDYETAAAVFAGPKRWAKMAQAAQQSAQNFATGQSLTGAFFNSGSAAQPSSPINPKAGYLVGDVEGGAFGKHHFDQFWMIYNLKEYYDDLKMEGDHMKNDPARKFAEDAATVMTAAAVPMFAGGPLGAFGGAAMGSLMQKAHDKIANTIYENDALVDTVVTVGLSVAAVVTAVGGAVAGIFTGGAGAVAGFTASAAIMASLAAYKAARGYYSGGWKGAVAGAATGAINAYTAAYGVNVGLSYSYEGGFGASVGYGIEGMGTVGVSWSEQDGFGASIGAGYKGLGVNLSVGEGGRSGFGVSFGGANANYGWDKGTGRTFSLGASGSAGDGISAGGALSYNDTNGFGVSASLGYSPTQYDGTNAWAASGMGFDTNAGWSQHGGFTNSYEWNYTTQANADAQNLKTMTDKLQQSGLHAPAEQSFLDRIFAVAQETQNGINAFLEKGKNKLVGNGFLTDLEVATRKYELANQGRPHWQVALEKRQRGMIVTGADQAAIQQHEIDEENRIRREAEERTRQARAAEAWARTNAVPNQGSVAAPGTPAHIQTCQTGGAMECLEGLAAVYSQNPQQMLEDGKRMALEQVENIKQGLATIKDQMGADYERVMSLAQNMNGDNALQSIQQIVNIVNDNPVASTAISLAPGLNDAWDVLSAVNYASQGQYGEAALSLAGFVIPVVSGAGVRMALKFLPESLTKKLLAIGKRADDAAPKVHPGTKPCACLLEGTMVQTPEGPQMIESLAKGMRVITQSDNKASRVQLVMGKFTFATFALLNIFAGGTQVQATDTHHFWVEERQAYVAAGELKKGDHLRTQTGTLVAIDAIVAERIGESRAVYDLTVDQDHNYFVGELGFLVHNQNPCDWVPNGNSRLSQRPQHRYEIVDTHNNNDAVKTGISGQPLNKNQTSPRANAQVNRWNKAEPGRYEARVRETNIPNRAEALELERREAERLRTLGNSMNRHVRP